MRCHMRTRMRTHTHTHEHTRSPRIHKVFGSAFNKCTHVMNSVAVCYSMLQCLWGLSEKAFSRGNVIHLFNILSMSRLESFLCMSRLEWFFRRDFSFEEITNLFFRQICKTDVLKNLSHKISRQAISLQKRLQFYVLFCLFWASCSQWW